MPLTYELLAVMLEFRRASASEVLKSLQDDGLLCGGRGRIIIVDRTGMEATHIEGFEKIGRDHTRVML